MVLFIDFCWSNIYVLCTETVQKKHKHILMYINAWETETNKDLLVCHIQIIFYRNLTWYFEWNNSHLFLPEWWKIMNEQGSYLPSFYHCELCPSIFVHKNHLYCAKVRFHFVTHISNPNVESSPVARPSVPLIRRLIRQSASSFFISRVWLRRYSTSNSRFIFVHYEKGESLRSYQIYECYKQRTRNSTQWTG